MIYTDGTNYFTMSDGRVLRWVRADTLRAEAWLAVPIQLRAKTWLAVPIQCMPTMLNYTTEAPQTLQEAVTKQAQKGVERMTAIGPDDVLVFVQGTETERWIQLAAYDKSSSFSANISIDAAASLADQLATALDAIRREDLHITSEVEG